MYVTKLILKNFRNYEEQEIQFIKGINLFLGDNAQGKTNIIESIYISAFGKSYRSLKDEEIINFNKEFTRIVLEYGHDDDNGLENETIEFFVDRFGKKNILDSGVKVKKLHEHIGKILLVTFSPDSLDIVKGSPQKRRKFIDMICCQLSKTYYIKLVDYTKCLKLKNNMLRKNTNEIDREYLHILNEKMAEYIKFIVDFRKKLVDKLQEKSKVIHENITDSKEYLRLEYSTSFENLSKYLIKELLDKYLEIEIARKMSVKGIQKDDIIIYINETEVSKFGSQGQCRTALLTLKLADFEVLKEDKENTPILLLDDIMSELDNNRIQFLLKYIENYQSIITTTDAAFIKNIKNIKIQKVISGKLEIN